MQLVAIERAIMRGNEASDKNYVPVRRKGGVGGWRLNKDSSTGLLDNGCNLSINEH